MKFRLTNLTIPFEPILIVEKYSIVLVTMHVLSLQLSCCCHLLLVFDLRNSSSALQVVDIPERRFGISLLPSCFPSGNINLCICLILQIINQFKIVYMYVYIHHFADTRDLYDRTSYIHPQDRGRKQT